MRARDDQPLDPQSRLLRALDLAYRHLGSRDRTVAEVWEHLEAREIDAATIETVVYELTRLGYLDDERYARRFAEDRRALDDWGPDRIRLRLLALGIDRELAEASVARASRDELSAALALLLRRYPVAPANNRERERALQLLLRKGYELELAYEAVRALEQTKAA